MNFSMENILKGAIGSGAAEYLINSLVIALFTALIGVVVYLHLRLLYCTQSGNQFQNITPVFDYFSGDSGYCARPLLLTLAFQQSFLYGTIAILILVNIVHFFASPYRCCLQCNGQDQSEL